VGATDTGSVGDQQSDGPQRGSPRRKGLALLFGCVVWASVFAAVFSGFMHLVFTVGVDSTRLAYFGLLFLPQFLSSSAGAFAYAAISTKPSRVGRQGTIFAATTACVAGVIGVVWVSSALEDMPSGLELFGWLAVISGAVIAIDVPAAAVGGHWAARLAARMRMKKGRGKPEA